MSGIKVVAERDVASDSDPKRTYRVRLSAHCTCPGWRYSSACKHVGRVLLEVVGVER